MYFICASNHTNGSNLLNFFPVFSRTKFLILQLFTLLFVFCIIITSKICDIISCVSVCFFAECAWLLWHLYDCSITLNISCSLMKKYTIIGRLNYPHFRRNGITFHFQRFAHNSYIIYSVNAWRSTLQDMRRYYSRKGCTYLIGYITELGSSNKIHA